MSICEAGRFKGGCPTCDDPDGSQSYREYDTTYGTDEYRAWEAWFKAHNVPLAQVPFKGWVARDVERRRISMKVFFWYPGDEDNPDFGSTTVSYSDRHDGHGGRDSRWAVHTVQLESAPMPFPVMASVEVS
jgi:hypothetical protein